MESRRILLNLVTVVFLLLFCSMSHAANMINAASCTQTDVLSAINAASSGDTVFVPIGTCTWTSQLVITKAITLKGAGSSYTQINHSYPGSLILINPSSDIPIRVTGFYFKSATNNTGYSSIYINGSVFGSYALSKIRIDHNTIEKGTRGVQARGWVEGLIDNNVFINCNIGVGITGDNNYSWSRPIAAGTANTLFIEDNMFIINNNADREPNQQVYHQEGARTVTRYNIFDSSAYTNGNSLLYDSHGNQNYYRGSSDFRGQPLLEIYNNTFRRYKCYGEFMDFRGGSFLIHNNIFEHLYGSAYKIRLTEEESWQTAFFSTVKTQRFAEDQVNNSFLWNNSYNGTLITDIDVPRASDQIFIKKDRDYFMHEPQAQGGRLVYVDRPGGAMTFVDGPNAYYPYKPYVYPHPLQGLTTSADSTAPACSSSAPTTDSGSTSSTSTTGTTTQTTSGTSTTGTSTDSGSTTTTTSSGTTITPTTTTTDSGSTTATSGTSSTSSTSTDTITTTKPTKSKRRW